MFLGVYGVHFAAADAAVASLKHRQFVTRRVVANFQIFFQKWDKRSAMQIKVLLTTGSKWVNRAINHMNRARCGLCANDGFEMPSRFHMLPEWLSTSTNSTFDWGNE